MEKFKEFVKKGLPPCQDRNGNSIYQYTYKVRLVQARSDITKFQDMEGTLKVQVIIEKIIDDLQLLC